MEILGKWGAHLFVPQMFLGLLVYAIAIYGGVDDDVAIDFALSVAGVVAIFFMAIAMWYNNTVGIAVVSSSLAAVLAIFCALAGANIFAGFFGFIGLVAAMRAALLVKSEGASEPLTLLFLSALPVLGAFMFLNLRLDEERKKIEGE
ncbi:hypothetical protein A3A36_00370 [Candidatus Kaiserbacteria bacterium RIFCSPLOWO2_01_FULL_52_12b]|uniref:Uncharacterized protein n=1 Tax=Candidatus Kaiserbacteria bacterium RIFCSPLOWO2_01_FULL_52_12b TaxID=1798509 RepID=A0A1F6EXX3_9BACT|nr:MAG: hypothetical protein A3A36_00370 [Candidatus Kaiserbacteria bacterium RIFCSPLOWO2_01_FULL_52_12b]